MAFLFEILESFDNPSGTRKKEPKNKQAIVTLLMMYLAMGEDYPYNIAKNFKNVSNDYRRGFSLLKYAGKVAVLLKEMEDKGLVISQPGKKIQNTNNYKINPTIIESLVLDCTIDRFDMDKEELPPEILRELIEEFLSWMEKRYKDDERRIAYLSEWSSLRRFDLTTLLDFLEVEARKWESTKDVEPSERQIELSEYFRSCIDFQNFEFSSGQPCREFLPNLNPFHHED